MFELKISITFSFILVMVDAAFGVSHQGDVPFPRLFKFDETEVCPNQQIYCKINVKLSPIDEHHPPEIWRRMEEVNNASRRFYRRDLIYRAGCFEKNSVPKTYDEYKHLGLNGTVDYTHCQKTTRLLTLDHIELIMGMAIICYIIFIIYSTIRTYRTDKQTGEVNRFIETCSLINIWKEIRKPKGGEDFQRLQCFQGMRTVTMIFIIMAHNFVLTILRYTENPEYVEEMYMNPLCAMLIKSFGYLVHIFFIISSWLLAVQLQNIVRKNGEINIKDVLLLALNRYFRLIPAVIVVIFLHSTTCSLLNIKPVYDSYIVAETERCKTGRWRNMFFIQNLEIFDGQICSPGTWYIAVDTQIYLLVVILFYLSEKFKISIKYFFMTIVSITIAIQGNVVLKSDFDGLLRFNPRLLPGETFFSRPEFVYSYTSTITNIPTYFIGYIFGEIYSNNKQKNIFDTAMKKLLWITAFLTLPSLAFYLDHQQDSRLMEALLAVSLRPIFALGIAIGLLGMSTGTGGFVKSFFEWHPLVFLGNFTYSVYMFHFLMIFGGMAISSQKAVFMDDFLFIRDNVIDIIKSFSIGFVMYIVLEFPSLQLQKMILPQVIMKKGISKKD